MGWVFKGRTPCTARITFISKGDGQKAEMMLLYELKPQ